MNVFCCLALCLVPLFVGAWTTHAVAGPDEGEAGAVKAVVDGAVVALPMLKSDYRVQIEGSLATVTLRQTFLNNQHHAVNATYLFPLYRKAAVYAMTMEVGEDIIEAVIQRTEEAKATFEAARAEGKAAALLEQHRPNMFTQNIANLMPGSPITVTLKYAQTVAKVDGAYELVVPFVVGPRYEGSVSDALAARLGLQEVAVRGEGEPAPPPSAPQEREAISGWLVERLPAYPPVFGRDGSAAIDHERVSFALDMRASVPIRSLSSSTHTLDVTLADHEAAATLAAGRVIGNRDLVLRYTLGDDEKVAAGVLSHRDARGGFVALQIEPPTVAAAEMITPRELVFVVDTSGSMGGEPMRAAKRFMRAALKGLRPDDHFRILRFANNATDFSPEPLPATAANVRAGTGFVDGLIAQGGTELNRAVNAAFDLPPLDNTLRIVVFLTDGYIGADRRVLRTVAQRIGNARIYAFGVGSAVNRFLLEGLAQEGRGRARYIENGESAGEAAEVLAQSLDAPLLTDIAIDWNGLQVDGQSPARIGDLFAGGSVHVLARYQGGGAHQIRLTGRVNGRPASLAIDMQLAATGEPSDGTDGDAAESALPLIWARERIAELERAYTLSGGTDDRFKREITELGLNFSLQSAFTSFVAVSKAVYNTAPGEARGVEVKLPQVHGLTGAAYPRSSLSGSSTPEPDHLLGLLAALIVALARFRALLSHRLRALNVFWSEWLMGGARAKRTGGRA